MRTFLCAIAGLTALLFASGAGRAATLVEVTGIWGSQLLDNTTGYSDGVFTGPANDSAAGLGTGRVTYDFSATPIADHAGAEFYVYEATGGDAEFGEMDVLLSTNGVDFTSVKSTEKAPVNYAVGGIFPRLAGDTVFSNAGYNVGAKIKGYDLSGLGSGYEARYIRVQGVNPTGNGFDLNAVGLIPIPEPTTLSWLSACGLALLCLRRRRPA